MGLDLALAIVVLIAAFRGWLQGLISQTVRIASLIACVYLADRVRDYTKPYVAPYLATIQSDLVDRLLWWVSAVAVYVVLVGVAMLVIKMTRRPEIPGISQSGRNDQFAGFFLGGTKGLLLVAFMAAGIERYGSDQVKAVGWAEDQVKASWAMQWSEAYQPVRRIWSSRPVRHFVNHINRMGVQRPGEPSQSPAGGEDTEEEPPVRTASRPSGLQTPGLDRSRLESTERSRSPSIPPAESPVVDPETDKSGAVIQPESKPRAKESN
jgi:uncharacterized membrane protein required for colicin V production